MHRRKRSTKYIIFYTEEKRALALITFEEKQQKDNKIGGDFRSMLTQRLKESGNLDDGAANALVAKDEEVAAKSYE